METISAEIVAVLFNNAKGWSILKVESVNGTFESGDQFTKAVGVMPHPIIGEEFDFHGAFEDNAKWGQQFKFERYDRRGLSKTGFERWLALEVDGVGPIAAEAIALKFEDLDHLHDVIRKEPDEILAIPGIGSVAISSIQDALRIRDANLEVENSRVQLLDLGMTSWQVGQAIQKWGASAGRIVLENPYKLMEVDEMGWRKADEVGRKAGIEKDAPSRCTAGMRWCLDQYTKGRGNTIMSVGKLLEDGGEALGVSRDALFGGLDQLRKDRLVIDRENSEGKKFVAPTKLNDYEARIAKRIVHLATQSCEGDPQHMFDPEEAEALNVTQKMGLKEALSNRVIIITGGPGVGKTFLCNFILQEFDRMGLSVACCAPTGKAANRLMESTGREASTIHRLLEYSPADGAFHVTAANPLKHDVVVVDECSMVDVWLAASLLDAVKEGGRLILVGDVDQLPSVGPGAVMRDLIDCGAIPVARLDEVMRQAEGSKIITGAHQINNGELPDTDSEPDGDLFWFKMDGPETIREQLVELMGKRIPENFNVDPVRDVQLLVPMRKGPVGVESLNELLAPIMNPGRDPNMRLDVGDRVMNIRNDYNPVLLENMRENIDGSWSLPAVDDVDDDDMPPRVPAEPLFNGYTGFVTRRVDVFKGINKAGKKRSPEKWLAADFDGTEYAFKLSDYDKVPAWASTIHKSQGSEYPVVVVAMYGGHWIMLRRNLLYTAVTRASRACLIVGPEKAVAQAVKCTDDKRRVTQLKRMIQEAMGK